MLVVHPAYYSCSTRAGTIALREEVVCALGLLTPPEPAGAPVCKHDPVNDPPRAIQ